MPINIKDETKWEKAKKIVNESLKKGYELKGGGGKGSDSYYALVNHIYQNVGGTFTKKTSLHYNNDDVVTLCKMALEHKNLKIGKDLADIIREIAKNKKTAALNAHSFDNIGALLDKANKQMSNLANDIDQYAKKSESVPEMHTDVKHLIKNIKKSIKQNELTIDSIEMVMQYWLS